MNAVREFLERSTSNYPTIAVLGDPLIDEYYRVEMTRISPEAPVPVLRSTSTKPYIRPGGAGNVLRQFHHLLVHPILIAPLDPQAARAYASAGIDTTFCSTLPNGRIPIKRRYTTQLQPLFRHDIEVPDFGEPDIRRVRKDLLRKLDDVIAGGLDALVLSDYDKGTLDADLIQRITARCIRHNIPVIVDPKNRPLTDWRNVTVIKCNAKEAHHLTGTNHSHDQAEAIIAATGCKGVIVTHADKPPTGATTKSYIELPPTRPTTVRSVIGAGDCFIAFLTTAIALGMRYDQAALVAHEAGQVYVTRHHNNPVMLHELEARVDPIGAKIVGPEEMAYIRDNRHPTHRVVFTNGCFDLTHAGHAGTLQWAKDQGDVLVVGLNTDASVRKLKGPTRPVLNETERARMIAALGCVDYVVLYDEDTPEPLITQVRPQVLVKGPDNDPNQVPGRRLVGQVLIAPPNEAKLHASDIISRIRTSPASAQ